MEQDSVIQSPPKANSFAEFKAAKRAAAEPKEPATDQQPPAQPGDKGASETAGASEASGNNPQEQQPGPGEKPEPKPAKRSLENRLKELRAQGKHEEADKILRDAAAREEKARADGEKARADKLAEELQTIRTRKPATEQTAQTTTHQAAPAESGDPEPKAEQYDGTAGKTYEDYIVDKAAWKNRQRDRADRQTQQQASLRESVNRKVSAARVAHPDFDQVTAGDAQAGTGFIVTPAMQQFAVLHDQGFEVLYKLASDQVEYQRIRALDPVLQLAELGLIARGIAAPAASAAAAPEKPKPPVSRVPPPPARTGGTESAPPKTTRDATNYAEFKRIKHRQG